MSALKVKAVNFLDTLVSGVMDVGSKFDCQDGYFGSVTSATCTNGYLVVNHNCRKGECPHILSLSMA